MQTLHNLPAVGLLLMLIGCNAIADIQRGTLRQEFPCSTLTDCTVEVPECRQAVACEQSRCIFQDAIEGTPPSTQTAGDCIELQCDGKGKTKSALAPADIPDDGNPCTLDACNGSEPVHLLQTKLPCYSGPPETEGKGICYAGVQHCDAQGSPIGGCEGELLPQVENCISPLDDDCDGQLNEEGAECACKPGEIVPCYTGPAETLGVGACHDGMKGCAADGTADGPCMGEQTPAVETCDAAMTDEDCDGRVNEDGADCTCGDHYLSPGIGEACDDGNLDSDDACNASCQPPGCGDGYMQPSLGELCDDGNLNPNDACAACQPWACGDGMMQEWESCDDGNTMDGDACPASCLRSVAKLGVGGWSTCVLLTDGRVKCWGDNYTGGLGLGDMQHRGDTPGEMGDNLPAVDLGTGRIAVAITGGGDHHCVLLSNGSIKCWGSNEYGQLGLGDTENRGDGPDEMGDNLPSVDLGAGKTAVAIEAGGYMSCALLNDGSVKCWGRNEYGALGLGDVDHRGDDPNEMGDGLPKVDLGTGKTAVSIKTSGTRACALLNDGNVKCWGGNDDGQLGLGDVNRRGDDPNEMGDNLPAVNFGTGKTATAIACSAYQTCVILGDGNVKCWGFNQDGELGLGDIISRGDGPNEMGDNLPIVDLGVGKTAVAIDVNSFTCALLQTGHLKCWGRNLYGELGLGDIISRGDEPNGMGDNLPALDLGTAMTVSAFDASMPHPCAIVNGGRLKCWGWNDSGQLGLGDTIQRGDDPWEMGNALPFVAP